MDNKICRSCHAIFESWGELAMHLDKTHDATHKHDRAGKLWAKRYIHRNAINKLKKIGQDLPYRAPLTEEQQEAKQDTRRELSGDTELVPVKCPRCNKGSRQYLEVEHTSNPQALRIDNCYVKLCEGCR